MKRYFALLAVLLLGGGMVGCGQKLPKDMPKVYPVTLTIKMDGQPVVKGTVCAYPKTQGKEKWYGSCSATDSSGVAKMLTVSQYAGLIEGEHIVTVSKERLDPIPNSPEFDVIQEMPRMYVQKNTSPLTITVTAGGPNKFDLVLE